MAYLSWTLTCLILGGVQRPLTGSRIVTLPLAASFLMVAWDLAQDPVWSTILHAWIWPHAGPYFGVPVSNFRGWFLTVYVMYQCFALYLRSHPARPGPLPPGFWHLAVLFYGMSAAGNVLLAIPVAGPSMVSDPTGRQWRVSDITVTSALVSVFTMGAFALLAWLRIADQDRIGS